MRIKRVLVTGATGFVGRHAVPYLANKGYKVRVALRHPAFMPAGSVFMPAGIESAVLGDITHPHNLGIALRDIDAVLHCAGVAHATETIAEDIYQAINHHATVHLAKAAQKAGVKRFVFLSSVRAQAGPVADHVLTENLPPQPQDAYGRSKRDAEQALMNLDMDHAALRPVLVYGAGVKGNMQALMRLVQKPWPLPFGALKGRRSLLAIDNLCSAIDHVLAHNEALHGPFNWQKRSL
jgi:nucleoside-diphosphate-sugar epimerase